MMNALTAENQLHPGYKILTLLGCAALAIPLLGYLITGSFMRFSGDDYCYGGILTQNGFWKAQWASYWQVMPYHGNRYALTLLSDIGNLLGPLSSGVLPGLAILLFFTGLLFTLQQVRSLAKLSISQWELALAALLVVFFSLYQAPSLSQSLYWRSGMLPYFAPLIVNTFVAGLLLKAVRRERATRGEAALIVLLAFIGGGFSETATALQIGFLGLLLVGMWWWGRKGSAGAAAGLRLGLAALVTTGVALLLLAVSPSIDQRLANVNRPDLFSFLWITLRSALGFIYNALSAQPIPTAINFLLFSTLTYLSLPPTSRQQPFTARQYLLAYALIAALCLGLILCITAPSAYAQAAYPELRALFTARFILVIGISLAGLVSGRLLQHWLGERPGKSPMIKMGALILAALLLIYPIYASRNIYDKIPQHQRWAAFWDERHQAIQAAVQAGERDLEVVQIDHIIQDVGDLYPNPKHWHNVCASAYYGVNSIAANQPGWDE